jgi:predicted ATPase
VLISLSGAQSCGKTTLLQECKKLKFLEGATFVDEVTRKIAKQGISINTDGNNLTQLLIINEHIQNSLLTNAFLDRCIVDGFIYTEYLYKHEKVDGWVYRYVNHIYDMLLPKYDIIFYCAPEGVPLEDDGTRVVGKEGEEFRNEIIQRFNYNFIVDRRLGKKTRVLTGSVVERMNKIHRVLEEEFERKD